MPTMTATYDNFKFDGGKNCVKIILPLSVYVNFGQRYEYLQSQNDCFF